MPGWTTFAGFSAVVLVALLALSRLTTRRAAAPKALPPAGTDARDPRVGQPMANATPGDLSPGVLLANVALSQGLFCGLLLAGAVIAAIPPAALGVAPEPGSVGLPALVRGLALGVGLYVATEVAGAVVERTGLDADDGLRASLAPGSALGWGVLFLGVLPVVAVFEELLFRAALVGALSAGFPVSPWLLVVGSSLAFGLGHGMQGYGGMVVTGGLGLVLGAAFVLTGSLLTVVVAHYVVNALEFLVHEGAGIEWL